MPGNKILITTESESLADSSLVQQKVLSAEEAQRAAVISQDDDHSGKRIHFCVCVHVFTIVAHIHYFPNVIV